VSAKVDAGWLPETKTSKPFGREAKSKQMSDVRDQQTAKRTDDL
jgi:hypothetical protein